MAITQIEPSKKFIRNENIIARRIHGAFFLIDITDNYSGDKCSIYEINETGMFLWQAISSERTAHDLAMLLLAEIVDDVDYAIVHEDVLSFLVTLCAHGFLLEVN